MRSLVRFQLAPRSGPSGGFVGPTAGIRSDGSPPADDCPWTACCRSSGSRRSSTTLLGRCGVLPPPQSVGQLATGCEHISVRSGTAHLDRGGAVLVGAIGPTYGPRGASAPGGREMGSHANPEDAGHVRSTTPAPRHDPRGLHTHSTPDLLRQPDGE